ncbi:hypothetical protein [Mesorhizobium sp. Z1-4]|uniref:hypothetical protein n=1 Tax=Mesorhizobium sp. Z1-4 TaxID=2448478 RepID=UPI000FD9D358|nr:hypothetical protein [Mesorhizobium sp. Z1-4]
MTDISVTAASVVAGTNAVTENGRAGATITAGQVVYKDASDGKFKLADSDSGTAAVKVAYGIALNGAADGQPLSVAKKGDVTFNAVLTAGTAYYLSETAGGIQPQADVASEDVIFLGLAKSTTVLALDIQIPGVTVGA